MMTATVLEARILEMVEPSLRAMGYCVVQLRLAESRQGRTLQCVVERLDDVLMNVNDCEQISHTMSALLDVEDPIQSAYHLEVSSPGLERPLTRVEDFVRFCGHEAQVEMVMPIDGRKRFRGTLKAENAGVITLAYEKKEIALPFTQMKQAKLMATEALFRALFAAAEQGEMDSTPAPKKESRKMKKPKKTDKKQKKDHKKHKASI
jgi:ribosome maturation factor RimP